MVTQNYQMKLIATSLFILAAFISCSDKKDKQHATKAYNYRAPLNDRELINRLLDSSIQYGNDKAYARVASYHLLESQGEEFLYFAVIVANKYNDPLAHYHIYDILAHPRNGRALKNQDLRTQNFALYHLLKSYELGEESAKYQIEEIFGENKAVPKSSFYLQEYLKAEQAQKP